MTITDYDYYCGANVYITLGSLQLTEVAAISYQVQDSSTPIYGYSSRFFDAVAPGQKLIRGSLVINYVQPHYLASILHLAKKTEKTRQQALAQASSTEKKVAKKKVTDDYLDVTQSLANLSRWALVAGADPSSSKQAKINKMNSLHNQIDTLQEKWRGIQDEKVQQELALVGPMVTDIGLMGPFCIDINFGTNYMTRILDVFLSSKGAMIQIDESAIVEEYGFFARQVIGVSK